MHAVSTPNSLFVCGCVYVCVCTAVDGFLARKLNQVSDVGAWVM